MVWEIIVAIANIIIAIGVVVALLHYFLSKKDYRVGNEIRKKENAIKFAEDYALLLDNVFFISEVYRKMGISKEIDSKLSEYVIKHKPKGLNFDTKESSNVFGREDYASHIGEQINVKVLNVLPIYMQYYECSAEYDNLIRVLLAKIRKKEELSETDIFELNKVLIVITDKITTTLNRLEAMCMLITSNIADEGTIYNSLHQTFLSYVELMYPIIADKNDSLTKRYYTNIIKVYNMWYNRGVEDRQKEEAQRSDLLNKIDKNSRVKY